MKSLFFCPSIIIFVPIVCLSSTPSIFLRSVDFVVNAMIHSHRNGLRSRSSCGVVDSIMYLRSANLRIYGFYRDGEYDNAYVGI